VHPLVAKAVAVTQLVTSNQDWYPRMPRKLQFLTGVRDLPRKVRFLTGVCDLSRHEGRGEEAIEEQGFL
jgi:hypothetical protein